MSQWVEVADIVNVIPPWVAENLGANTVINELTGETVTQNCIFRAESYIKTLLMARGKMPPPNDWLPFLREAAVSLAFHYLYARIEQETIADDKLRDAKERLSMLFEGDMPGISGGGGDGIVTRVQAIGVAPGREDWYGYS